MKFAHDPSAIGTRGSLSKTFWPTLPESSETFVAEIASVVAEVSGSYVDGYLAIGYLLVRVTGARETVTIADHDRLNLKRAKLAVTTARLVVAAGFNRDESGQKEWMHGFVLVGIRQTSPDAFS